MFLHVGISEHSRLRRYGLYILARYIELPFLRISFYFTRGKWKKYARNRVFRWLLKMFVYRPVSYLFDTSKPIPYDEVMKYVDELDGKIAVGPCRCRIVHQTCNHPMETDFVIRTGYEAWMKAFPKDYREISKEETKRIITECHNLGMYQSVFLHCPSNLYNEYVICNCCTDGCVIHLINREFGQKNFPFQDGFYISVTDPEKCNGSKECIKICPFDSRKIVDGKGRVTNNCFGCGLCVSACPEKAITMVPLRKLDPREHDHEPAGYKYKFYKQHEPITEFNYKEFIKIFDEEHRHHEH